MKLASICAIVLAALLVAAAPPSVEERLAQHRNLGKAFYENPTTQAEAVAEFKAALALAPTSNREKLNYALAMLRAGQSTEAVKILLDVQKRDPQLPHTWFNLGIYYKKSGDIALAIPQFERLVALAPNEPIAHYQLAALYRLQDRTEDARTQFEIAVKFDPLLAAPRFQLYNLYRQAGQTADAAKMLAEFQRLKKQAEGAAIAEDVEWCNFAEIYDPPGTPSVLPPPTYTKVAGATGAALIGDGDLLTWAPNKITLYHGKEAVKDTGLESLTGIVSMALGDFDNDGLMDLCILTESGPLLYRNTKGRFVPFDAKLPQRRFEHAVWIDYDHDYDLDLILLGDTPALMRNEGSAGFADRTADFPFQQGHPTEARKLRAVPDTKAFDLAVWYSDHAPVLYRDQMGGRYTSEAYSGAPPNPLQVESQGLPAHWIKVQLEGVKSLKLAQDAEVEVKAGSLYQKKSYAGVPLIFPLGAYTSVDVVRITWPNGLIQNEVKQPANHAYVYKEAQRLSGSCPMIWTWNGRGIQFITDVLGVAPLGASDGEGTYFPVDHDEWVTIPGAALAAVNGQYDIRVTEELSEVSYLDQIKLFAVDHPAGTEIFTNEKFKGPPYPEDRLYRRHSPHLSEVRARRRRPRRPAGTAAARSGLSRSIPAQRTRSREAAHAGARFRRLRPRWACRAAAQRLGGLARWQHLPRRIAGVQGRSRHAVPANAERRGRMGDGQRRYGHARRQAQDHRGGIEVPIGVPQAAHRDHTLRLLGRNLPRAKIPPRPLSISRRCGCSPLSLHFRGFSDARIHPERKQPDTFLYSMVSPTSFWNPTTGLYTRYGDVRPASRRCRRPAGDHGIGRRVAAAL